MDELPCHFKDGHVEPGKLWYGGVNIGNDSIHRIDICYDTGQCRMEVLVPRIDYGNACPSNNVIISNILGG